MHFEYYLFSILKPGKSDSMVSKNLSPNKMVLNLKSFGEDGIGQFHFYERYHQSFKEPCLS